MTIVNVNNDVSKVHTVMGVVS